MDIVLFQALIREYIIKIDSVLTDLSPDYPPPKVREWIDPPKLAPGVPAPPIPLLRGLLRPTQDTPPELWRWVNDPDYVHPALKPLKELVDRMTQTLIDIEKREGEGES